MESINDDSFVINIQISKNNTLTLNSNVYKGFMTKNMTIQDLKNLVRFVNKMNDSVKFVFKYNDINMENNKKLSEYGIINDNKHLIQMIIKVEQSSLLKNSNKLSNNFNDYNNSLIILNTKQTGIIKKLHESIKKNKKTLNDFNKYNDMIIQNGIKSKVTMYSKKLCDIIEIHKQKLLNESKKKFKINETRTTNLKKDLKILEQALDNCMIITKKVNLQNYLNNNNNNNITKLLNQTVSKAFNDCTVIDKEYISPKIEFDEKTFETSLNKCFRIIAFQDLKIFKYSFDFDTNGILYWIGTSCGQTNNWINPHESGKIIVTSSGVDSGNVKYFVSRTNVQNRLINIYSVFPQNFIIYIVDNNYSAKKASDNSCWFQICFNDIKIQVNKYSFKTDTNNNEFIRSWNVEIWNNSKWIPIKKHVNDNTFNKASQIKTFNVNNVNIFTDKIRWIMTGKNSSDSLYLRCCGIELYGKIKSKNIAI